MSFPFVSVSIPYRLATNFWGFPCWSFCFPFVSIPYRLATNRALCCSHWGCLEEFQFLIGWLQTIINEPKRGIGKRFQFLIGWLQTVKAFFPTFPEYMFQFLIGWLQTMIFLSILFWIFLVSIPYRLATNLDLYANDHGGHYRFNSL